MIIPTPITTPLNPQPPSCLRELSRVSLGISGSCKHAGLSSCTREKELTSPHTSAKRARTTWGFPRIGGAFKGILFCLGYNSGTPQNIGNTLIMISLLVTFAVGPRPHLGAGSMGADARGRGFELGSNKLTSAAAPGQNERHEKKSHEPWGLNEA